MTKNTITTALLCAACALSCFEDPGPTASHYTGDTTTGASSSEDEDTSGEGTTADGVSTEEDDGTDGTTSGTSSSTASDGGASASSATASSSDGSTTVDDTSATGSPSGWPPGPYYNECDGSFLCPLEPERCLNHGLWRVCVVDCEETSDCPASGAGGATPQCVEASPGGEAPKECVLVCNPLDNDCPPGLDCVTLGGSTPFCVFSY